MSRLLRVLVACEFSGVVRSAFERRGWEAWSCDFLPTEKPSLFHYQGDVLDIISRDWDLCIMHPDCTYHVTSGNRWFYHPDDTDLPVEERRPHPLYPNRVKDRLEAQRFVKWIWGYAQKHIPFAALENPVGTLGSVIGKYSQIIQPYEHGHDRAKSTCLWLKGLPLLTPTNPIPPRIVNGQKRWGNQVDASGADKTPPGPMRKKTRSRTDTGIAEAMAAQWGSYIERLHTPCECCGEMGAERYRQRTRYTREESNWKTLCPECREDNDAYWDDLWAEYYSNLL